MSKKRDNPVGKFFNASTFSSQFEVVAGLGQGGYATVVLVKHRESESQDKGSSFAMKVVNKRNDCPKEQEQLETLSTELKVMRDAAPSRFLQRCHAAFESDTDVFFICDFIAGGDLYYHMATRGIDEACFNEDECRILLAEVTLGLEHLHGRGFIHCDLKVENIMLDAAGHVKLIDFGLAVEIEEEGINQKLLKPAGSLIYMSPELIKSKRGGRHSDWWAMGILAYELMTGRPPWSSLTDFPVIKHEILNCQVLAPENVSASSAFFMRQLVQRDFRDRLGTEQDSDVRRAPFFKGVDWSAIARGETAPAFDCGAAPTDDVDHRDALDAYIRNSYSASHQKNQSFSPAPIAAAVASLYLPENGQSRVRSNQ